MDNSLTIINKFPTHVKEYSIVAFQKLDQSEQAFIEPALQTQISKQQRGECVDQIMDAVAYVFAISGQKAEAADILLHSNETYEWALRTFPYVTVPEIKQAFKRGIYGEYGDYFGLNTKTFVFFVRSYLESVERKMAKDAFEKMRMKLSAPKRELSDEDYKWWIQRDYQLFQEGQAHRIFYSKHKYFMLRKLKFIEFTSVVKWNVWLWKASREQIFIAKTLNDKSKVNHYVSVLDELEMSGRVKPSQKQILVIQARKMIYLKFLSIIMEFGYKNIFQEIETEKHKIR